MEATVDEERCKRDIRLERQFIGSSRNDEGFFVVFCEDETLKFERKVEESKWQRSDGCYGCDEISKAIRWWVSPIARVPCFLGVETALNVIVR